MAFQVGDETRRSASDCPKAFRCLEGAGTNLCPIEDCVGGEVHFIACRAEGYCPYQRSFGHGWLCACPVRKELYRVYHV